jgi:transposase InsO family protein
MKQVLSTLRSPWQRAYIERLIGTIRRECLDHNDRIQRALLLPTPSKLHAFGIGERQPGVPTDPPTLGRIIAIPEVGGLHHRYERRAA